MPLPREITATLLLDRPAQIDTVRLSGLLSDRLGSACQDITETKLRLDPLLRLGEFFVHLRPRDLPLSDARLNSALTSGLPTLLRDNLDNAVARHRAAITVTVGFGDGPDKEQGAAPSQEAFDRMLMLAHATVTQLARCCPPLALHWGQSDQILSEARFAAMANMVFPLPLYLHPLPRQQHHAGTDWLALDIAGARDLIGRPLRTAPAPVTLTWMMPRIYAIVTHLRASGLTVRDGSAFSTADGERFVARLDPDEGIRLILEEKDSRPVPRADAQIFSNAA